MQALIVAAGEGTRLRSCGPSKPLVQLAGKPLIAHVIERLKQGGVTQCVVVTGYLRDVLEPALVKIAAETSMPIKTVFNPAWVLANGVSVLSAAPELAQQFLLVMCDHLLVPDLVARMVQSANPQRPSLAVDFNTANPDVDLEDVTRVRVAGDDIQAIGKHLADYNGFDCGLFAASGLFLAALEKAARAQPSVSISDGVRALAQPLRAIDVTGLRWLDVDDPVMFARAENWLASC